MIEKENFFDEIEQESDVQTNNEQPKVEDNNFNVCGDEINFDDLSDIAIGQQKKYVRQNLDGKTIKIKSAKLFNANKDTDKLIESLTNPEVKYYKSNFIITFDSKNEDGVNDREYISGVVQFLQRDGTLSQPNFWHKNAKSQAARLWVKVAEHKNMEPEDLSPRVFMNFLNTEPTVEMEQIEIEYLGKIHKKNMIKRFVK